MSYHHYKNCPANDGFGCRCGDIAAARAPRSKFAPWWRAVNEALEDQGRAQILYRQTAAWWAEGLTPDQAVKRQLDNLESSQEERSYYDA